MSQNQPADQPEKYDRDQRNRIIASLRRAGLTYAMIARMVGGISASRVRHICNRQKAARRAATP